MPYTIDYTNLNGDAKVAKALADCRSYLGDKNFKLICEVIKDDLADGVEERTLILHMDLFVGISGYPAQVLIDHARSGGN